jgi:hypothetical protein
MIEPRSTNAGTAATSRRATSLMEQIQREVRLEW